MIKILKKAPEPPECLTELGKQHWNDIMPSLIKQGQVSNLDLSVLAMACNLFSAWENSSDVDETVKLAKAYVSIMEKFGVTSKGRKVLTAMGSGLSRRSTDAKLLKEFEA